VVPLAVRFDDQTVSDDEVHLADLVDVHL